MELLAAVRDGQVTRGADGGINAAFELDGRDVSIAIRRLAGEDLVSKPMNGLPRLLPRGETVLARER
jgi:hypothetical protein